MTTRVSQPELVWRQELSTASSVEPTWSHIPDIAAIRATLAEELQIDNVERIEVIFVAEGALNRVYKVIDTIRNEEYAMRLSLPVDPYFKTATEVATLQYLKSRTELPVPPVYAYSTESDNNIGFKWILMSFVPGVPLQLCWFLLSMDEKRNIIRHIVSFQTELFAH